MPTTYTVEGAPNWWKGYAYNPTFEQAYLVNALIPFMSPEGQRSTADWLGKQSYGSGYTDMKDYLNVAYPPPPSEMTTAMRDTFTSANRARGVLDTLTKMAQASDNQAMFENRPDYRFLKQIAGIMAQFGGGPAGSGNRQTRAQYQQMQTALAPKLTEAQNDKSLQQYMPQIRELINPTFTAGPVVEAAQDQQTGKWSFGKANKEYY